MFQQSTSKVQGSIQQINSYAHLWISMVRHELYARVIHMFDTAGTLYRLEPLKGSERALKRIARSVAVVIGIAMSMQSTAVGQGSIDPYTNIKELADYQLTDKQYKCHHQIIYRESRYDIHAVNGSHHGYYQIKNRLVIDKPYDYQFYFYWKYVTSRYGITEYDEPNYCRALHHLKTKGWQ